MRATHSGLRTLRAAACLLLAAISLDLAADTSCDAPPPLGSTLAVLAGEAGPAGDGEACAPVCVPDCFCCSRSVPATAVIVPPAPVLLSTLDRPARERGAGGFRPVVDHPPLPLA